MGVDGPSSQRLAEEPRGRLEAFAPSRRCSSADRDRTLFDLGEAGYLAVAVPAAHPAASAVDVVAISPWGDARCIQVHRGQCASIAAEDVRQLKNLPIAASREIWVYGEYSRVPLIVNIDLFMLEMRD